MGIERTYQQMEQADIILWIIDCTDTLVRLHEIRNQVLHRCENAQLVLLFNKADLVSDKVKEMLLEDVSDIHSKKLFISAKHHDNLPQVEELLVKLAALPEITQNDIIVTNIRHYEALTRALDSIHRVQEGMSLNLSGDLISEDLRQCIYELSDIVGEVTTDEVLGTIFANFCVGK